jgi:exosortase F-associated protein
MNRFIKVLGASLGIVLLVGVRVVGSSVFYDPLIDFYHGEYKTLPFPTLEYGKYALNIALRFLVNSVISLGIIYLLFRSVKHVIVSSWVLLITGLIGVGILMFLLIVLEDPSKQAVFYVRRLLIHPLMLFILVPALYFQELNNKKSNTLK